MHAAHINTSERAMVVLSAEPYINNSSVLLLQHHSQVSDLGWVLNPAPLPLMGLIEPTRLLT